MKPAKLLFFLLFILPLLSCTEKVYLPASDALEESSLVAQQAVIRAAVENPSAETRTALEGNKVVWTAGDAFSLLSCVEDQVAVNNVLEATVSAASSGLGINVSTSGTAYVRYSGIQVTLSNGTDVTSTFTSTAATSSNSYKVGIYNSSEKYQYAAAGQTVTAEINANSGVYTIPLVQSSSSSNVASTPLTIRLTALQYSLDNQTWTDVNESTVGDGTVTLNNGFGGKAQVSFSWQSSGTSTSSTQIQNDRFTLNASDEGYTSADFTGTVSAGANAYYALYPYATTNSFDGTNLTFSLPQEQTYAAGTFASGANPSAGIYEQGKVNFKNLCGVLELKLTGTETVTGITLADQAGTSLWGTGSVAVSAIGQSGATFTGGSNEVTLTCGAGVTLNPETPTSFYIVVPVGSLISGFTATVQTPNGVAQLETTRDNGIQRSKVRSMPACGLGEIQLEEFSIMNPVATTYFQNSTSTFTGGADSRYGSSFFTASYSYRPDQPVAKTLTFTGTSGTQATVELATDASYTNQVLQASITLTGGQGSYDLVNLVPGVNYYYRVTQGENTLLSGAFKAVGQVRMIAVDGVKDEHQNLGGFNIRDLGGWTGLNGKKLRYEQIYRGASLGGTDASGNTSSIGTEAQEELHRIGIRAQLDLRAETNGGAWTGENSRHSYAHGTTTLLEADYNNTMTDYGYTNQDASLISDVAWIIYELKRGKPVYFNCRQGADRTGTVAFILEALLGCYDYTSPGGGNQMAIDYELTGFSGASSIASTEVSAYRSAAEVYANTSKVFNKIINLTASGITFTSVQQKCYYYLNQYAKTTAGISAYTHTMADNTICIDKADLDWFIQFMLNMTETEYTTYRPSWASTGDDLKTIAEVNANVVIYAE